VWGRDGGGKDWMVLKGGQGKVAAVEGEKEKGVRGE